VLPSLNVPVAMNCCVAPGDSVDVAGVTAIDNRFGGVRVSCSYSSAPAKTLPLEPPLPAAPGVGRSGVHAPGRRVPVHGESPARTRHFAVPRKMPMMRRLPASWPPLDRPASSGPGLRSARRNRVLHPPVPAGSHAAPNNGNGSAAASGFNQLRNEFLTAARRVATAKKQAIGEVVEWASGGVFKHGDVGRMTGADAPKLRAATELMASGLAGTCQ